MSNIVKISDGLGNQMFQYAFARKLQLISGSRVYLDIRFINNEDRIARGEKNRYLKKNDYREYGLDKFKITIPIADEKLLAKWNYIYHRDRLEEIIYELAQNGLWFWQYKDERRKRAGRIITDKDCIFPTYFEGYYFNPVYYEDIRLILQKEFHLRRPFRLSKELGAVLQNEESVSIHIRRGDFLKLNWDISRKAYYPKAIKMMNEHVKNPIYLVFSDDIEWVKRNIEIDGRKIYISSMGLRDYEEFTIMKHCRHHIIANSTFSYWAAWLNPYSHKLVIYPKRWENSSIAAADWIGL